MSNQRYADERDVVHARHPTWVHTHEDDENPVQLCEDDQHAGGCYLFKLRRVGDGETVTCLTCLATRYPLHDEEEEG